MALLYGCSTNGCSTNGRAYAAPLTDVRRFSSGIHVDGFHPLLSLLILVAFLQPSLSGSTVVVDGRIGRDGDIAVPSSLNGATIFGGGSPRLMRAAKTDDRSAPDGAVGTWTLTVNKSDIVRDPAAPTPTPSSKPDACAMWRPPGVKKARGVVLSASLIPDQFWQDGSAFRKAVEQAQMVAIILNCSVSRIHNASSCEADARPCKTSTDCAVSPCTHCDGKKCVNKHPEQIDLPEDVYVPKTLAAFADASGMPEISGAPVFAMGWSAAGPFAMHVAYALPSQTLGFLYYHSGTMTCPTHFSKAPGCATNETFSAIPFLAINGECEQ